MRYTQPQNGAQIDWGNPITRGLVFLSSQHNPYDLVSRVLGTGAGILRVNASVGLGTDIAGSSNAVTFGANDSGNVLGAITCLALGSFADTSVDRTSISKCSSNGASNTPFDFGITSGGGIRLGRASSGYRVWGGAAAVTPNKIQMIAASHGEDIGVAPKFYRDGVFDTGAATSLYGGGGSGNAGASTAPIRMHNRGDASTWQMGGLFLAAVWQRELSAVEHASLKANPWQLFKSPQRVILAAAAGSPSGTFATTMGDATLAASGAVVDVSTFAATMANATMAASGAVTDGGTFFAVLVGATMSAAGGIVNTGPFAATLAGFSMAAIGSSGAFVPYTKPIIMRRHLRSRSRSNFGA